MEGAYDRGGGGNRAYIFKTGGVVLCPQPQPPTTMQPPTYPPTHPHAHACTHARTSPHPPANARTHARTHTVVLMRAYVIVACLSSRTVLVSLHVPMYSRCRHTTILMPAPSNVSVCTQLLTCPYRARTIRTPAALSCIRSSTADRTDRLARSHLFSTTTSAARNCSQQQQQ